MTDERQPITGEIIQKWRLTKPTPTNSKLTPAVAAAVLEGLANGASAREAAAAAGVAHRTFYYWQTAADADPDSIYAEFRDMVAQARAQAELANVAIVRRAADTTWQAAAWLLERAYPERWGRRDAIHTTGDVQHRIVFEFGDKVALPGSDGEDNDD